MQANVSDQKEVQHSEVDHLKLQNGKLHPGEGPPRLRQVR